MGAVALALAAGGCAATTSAATTNATARDATAGGTAECPATVLLTVSAAPRSGIVPVVPAQPTASGADQHLVPTEAPRSAVLCQYRSVPVGTASTASSVPLAAAVAVTTGRDDLARELAALPSLADHPGPASCTEMGGPLVPYLLGLDYAEGRVWVAASAEPNRCSGASNGRFETRRYAGGLMKAVADSNG